MTQVVEAAGGSCRHPRTRQAPPSIISIHARFFGSHKTRNWNCLAVVYTARCTCLARRRQRIMSLVTNTCRHGMRCKYLHRHAIRTCLVTATIAPQKSAAHLSALQHCAEIMKDVLRFLSLLSLLAFTLAVSQQDSPVVGIVTTPASDCGAPPPGFNGTTCVERYPALPSPSASRVLLHVTSALRSHAAASTSVGLKPRALVWSPFLGM